MYELRSLKCCRKKTRPKAFFTDVDLKVLISFNPLDWSKRNSQLARESPSFSFLLFHTQGWYSLTVNPLHPVPEDQANSSVTVSSRLLTPRTRVAWLLRVP